MKTIKKSLLALLLFAMPFGVAQAQSKVAHIEVQKLVSEMPEVIAAQKEIESKTPSVD